ncbi:hypothetical protein [Spiroplasma turonicum]|uniref:Transmembrane protein n=1 Tax=Spiroplasma turonicum TaxID=216946 RepID=A0A0K1P5Y9_9MOLU|nr:hypothetical protein [Spiroplasma turonicum]AKU79680.1 hypothetical protein STURON_00434 [Spiroplasma turonicum]ALX70700.1 hypothetical protein STURO_v1c04320 [Spiroplasma turonicum]
MNGAKLIILISSCTIAFLGFLTSLIVMFSGSSLTIVIPSLICGFLIVAAAMVNVLFCFRQVLKLKVSLILSFVYTLLVIILFILYPIIIGYSKDTLIVYSSILAFTLLFYVALIFTNFSEKIKTIEY